MSTTEKRPEISDELHDDANRLADLGVHTFIGAVAQVMGSHNQVLFGRNDGPADDTKPSKSSFSHRGGRTYPSKTEQEAEEGFAPSSREVLNREPSTGPTIETRQLMDIELAQADWNKALRTSNGNVRQALAIARKPGYVAKGNPKV